MARLLLIALGLWALCTFAATAQARRCYHDGLETKDVPTLNVEYPAHVQKRANRQPMRFHTVIDDTDTALSAEQWEYVRQITPLATSYISNMLKVTPATAPIGIQPTCTSTYTVSGKCAEIDPSITCGKSTVPQELIFSIPVCPNDPDTCTNQPAQSGQGVNADFILFVNAKKGGCGASTLAFASHCGKDQNDRPISGFFTICPSVFPEGWTKATSSPTFLATTLSTFVHEVAHALGFSSSLFNYFRDENGNPRVPRDARGRPQQDTAGAVRKVSTERGHTVTKIVTPAVVKVARELSGCPTLDGAELEDGGGSGTAGSHWEERQWWGEFMNGQDTAIRFAYSKLTLALFQDSGWYDVDLESGQTVLWNYGAGCESISGNCLQGDKLNPTSTNRFQWCTTPGQALCSPDRLSTARCSISTFTKDLPAFYQYFSDPKRGGGSSAHDYCPKLSTSYDPANGYDCLGPVSTTPSASDFSMKSLQSRCIIGDLTGPGYVYNGEVTARCYPLTCVRDANGEPTSVNIKLGDKSVTCTKEGDSVTLEGSQGTLICPPLKQVCPFNADCPNSCNGFGTCEKDGKCNCWAGFSGTDCSVYKANKKREAHVSEYMAMLAEQMAVQATPEEDFSRAFADELATASFKYDAAAPGCKAIVTGWLANFPITYSESDPYEVVFRKMIGLVKTLMTTYTDSKTTRCFGPADTRPSVFDSPYDPPSMDPILRPMFVAVSATPVSAADLGKAVGKLALLKGSVLLRQNEVPTRVAPTVTVPAQWTCEQSSYGSLDGCDCDCGAPDPDCDVMTEKSDLYNCGQGSSPKCVAGECTYSTAPAGWTCDPNFYDAGDGCDCGCGVQDPDCSNDLAPVLNCEAGDNPKCVAGQCKYNRVIPKGWVCADSYYDNNDGCHCDCGVWDPDCDKPKIGLLTNCPCPSMKCVKADDPNVSPACQGTCRNTVYQAKSATVPTISSAVKTPGVAATRNNDITQLSFNFAALLNKV